jgi:hypothetical protein
VAIVGGLGSADAPSSAIVPKLPAVTYHADWTGDLDPLPPPAKNFEDDEGVEDTDPERQQWTIMKNLRDAERAAKRDAERAAVVVPATTTVPVMTTDPNVTETIAPVRAAPARPHRKRPELLANVEKEVKRANLDLSTAEGKKQRAKIYAKLYRQIERAEKKAGTVSPPKTIRANATDKLSKTILAAVNAPAAKVSGAMAAVAAAIEALPLFIAVETKIGPVLVTRNYFVVKSGLVPGVVTEADKAFTEANFAAMTRYLEMVSPSAVT